MGRSGVSARRARHSRARALALARARVALARVDPARASDPVRWHRADALRRVASSSSAALASASDHPATSPSSPPHRRPRRPRARPHRPPVRRDASSWDPVDFPSVDPDVVLGWRDRVAEANRSRRVPHRARRPQVPARTPRRSRATSPDPGCRPHGPNPDLARALLVDAFDAGAYAPPRVAATRPRRRRRGQTPRQMRLRLRRALPPPRGRNRHAG